ncbi:hypothetical protein DFJ74DRAFT_87193 [Hyaloraphidium curvatum]|nr:hypothetical protein DFJ74DRAFT_87193 [Hyaloraphidium curvatum]
MFGCGWHGERPPEPGRLRHGYMGSETRKRVRLTNVLGRLDEAIDSGCEPRHRPPKLHPRRLGELGVSPDVLCHQSRRFCPQLPALPAVMLLPSASVGPPAPRRNELERHTREPPRILLGPQEDAARATSGLKVPHPARRDRVRDGRGHDHRRPAAPFPDAVPEALAVLARESDLGRPLSARAFLGEHREGRPFENRLRVDRRRHLCAQQSKGRDRSVVRVGVDRRVDVVVFSKGLEGIAPQGTRGQRPNENRRRLRGLRFFRMLPGPAAASRSNHRRAR